MSWSMLRLFIFSLILQCNNYIYSCGNGCSCGSQKDDNLEKLKYIKPTTKQIKEFEAAKESCTILENEENKTMLQGMGQKINTETPTSIKKKFVAGKHLGLENVGATCYMNATLQCFCHIESFINFFKYNKRAKEVAKDNNNLTYSFKLLIDNLWPDSDNGKTYYSPHEFKNKISKMNPLFKGVAANDSKDLVNFIIMQLHDELNKAENNNISNNINNIIDQRNSQLVFNNFANNFMATNKSIISDLFYGVNCSMTRCNVCNTPPVFSYQTYFFIVFPLEEVRKYNGDLLNNNFYNLNDPRVRNYNKNIVDIYDCFNYDRKTNAMWGNNSMYCNYCRNNCAAQMCTSLTTGPKILILLLNRGKGIEFNVKVNFYEELNLYNYIQINSTGHKYRLMGVITHLGESGMGGHFIAYCRDPIDQTWHKYNDKKSSPVNDFKGEIIDYAMPYLLFYEKTDGI